MRHRSAWRWTLTAITMLTLTAVAASTDAAAPIKSRVVLIAPFDASALESDDRWLGEAVTQVLALGLVQHQAFIPLERSRLRGPGPQEAWGPDAVQQAARSTRADVALFGR